MVVVKVIAGYNSISLLNANPSNSRCETSSLSSSSKLMISKQKSSYVYFGAKTANSNKNITSRKLVVYANSAPGVPPPTGSNPKNWILGLIITFVLPFFGNKWGPLWVLKNRIDGAVQLVENLAEKVEDIAEEVDKVIEDIADDLPEGKLKTLMGAVEDAAEKAAKAADVLDDTIDKVQEAEESLVESLEKEKKSSIEKKDESSVDALGIEPEKSSSVESK